MARHATTTKQGLINSNLSSPFFPCSFSFSVSCSLKNFLFQKSYFFYSSISWRFCDQRTWLLDSSYHHIHHISPLILISFTYIRPYFAAYMLHCLRVSDYFMMYFYRLFKYLLFRSINHYNFNSPNPFRF